MTLTLGRLIEKLEEAARFHGRDVKVFHCDDDTGWALEFGEDCWVFKENDGEDAIHFKTKGYYS